MQEARDRGQERRGNLQGGVNLIRGLRCQASGCKRQAARKVWVVRTIRYPLKEVEPGLKAEIGPSGERGPHHVVREVPLCDHHINKIQSQPVRITGRLYDLWSF